MIPKLIHFMWLDKTNPYTRDYPEKYRENVEKWTELNRDWTVIMWNMEDIQREFPEWMEVLDSIPIWISKCDFARFLVLYKMGGVYIDLDFIPKRPFDDYVTNRDLLLLFEPKEHMEQLGEGLLYNGIVGSEENHPFILGWIHKMAEDAPRNDKVYNVVKVTGPTGFFNYWRNTGIPVEEVDTCLFCPVTKRLVSSPYITYIPDRCTPYPPYCITKWSEGTFWNVTDGDKLLYVLLILPVFLILLYTLYKKLA
jgi:mannosyltransferase OCH1-like enzyme